MGICYGKSPSSVQEVDPGSEPNPSFTPETLNANTQNPNSTPTSEKWQYSPSPYRFNPFSSPWRSRDSSGKETPNRPRRPFPPPSPAKHITSLLLKRFGKVEENVNTGGDRVQEVDESGKPLNKTFGYSKNFEAKYELGEEVGRGHFGYTCLATAKKGEMKGRPVAVKVISKAKMTTAISIEDVKREVKILRALTGHANLVKFYDALEDNTNVYIVMEYCEGGELLDRILARGGKYSEEDAKRVIEQILNIVSYCHLQGVVHRDLKPENFLFTTKEETSELKVIDFGLSDYVRPDEKLNDIVGSAYYVAPEVLHRHYSIEADAWSIGVISYILLCGSRPFWARTESGIFRSVLRTAPSFDEAPWPSVSTEAKDFVQRLLSKERQRRMSVAQALAHPWIRGERQIPLDIMIFRQVKAYVKASALRQAALKALAKTLTEEDLFYFRVQFNLLEPNKHGRVGLENFKSALSKAATDAMKESRMFELITAMEGCLKSMNFEEFCAAAVNVHQLEGREGWDDKLREAYQMFDENGNRVVIIESIAKELAIPHSVNAYAVLHDWVRNTDGRLSFFGFSNYLRGAPSRTRVLRERQQ